VDEDLEDDEEILPNHADFDGSNNIEVIATQDSADFDDAAMANNPIETIDVYTIKTEFDPIQCNNDSLSTGENSKPPTKSKTSDSDSKPKASSKKSLDISEMDSDEPSSSKGNFVLNESDQETPRKTSKSSHTTDDEQSPITSTSVSEKKKEKSHKRKRREEDKEEHGDFKNKKIKQEVEEPERVPSRPYYYYVQNIYTGKQKKAKKTYIKLDPAERKRIRKEHKRVHREYLATLKEFCATIPSKKEMESFAQRMQKAEELELETSDPDE